MAPSPLSPEQAAQLLTSIDGLTGQVASLQVEVADARRAREADDRTRARENASRDQSAKWLRRLAIAALCAALIGIAVGARGVLDAGDASDEATTAKDAADAILEARYTARKVACDQANDTAARINGLNDRTQNLLRDAVAGRQRTPEAQAAADAFVAEQVEEFEALKVPLRDCSPAGIATYYEEAHP